MMKSAIVLTGIVACCPTPVAKAPGASNDVATRIRAMAEIKRAYSPSFSPDGTRIAYLSNEGGLPELWVDQKKITTLTDPIESATWSPDGAWIAFALAPGGGMNTQVYLVKPDGTEQHRITPGGKDNNWIGDWSRDGKLLTLSSSVRDPATMDSYVFTVDGAKLELVVKNPGVGSPTDIMPDGRMLVSRMEARGNDNLVLVDRGAESVLTPHDGPGSYWGAFGVDGKVYVSANTNRDRIAFGRIEIADGKIAVDILAARDDAEVDTFVIGERIAAIVWNVSGKSELAILDLAANKSRAIAIPHESLGGIRLSSDGTKLVGAVSGPNAPSDIWVLDIASGAWTQITHSEHPGVELESLVAPTLATFSAHDGVPLSGWLYRPTTATGVGPIVLSFHGGPEGQEVPALRSDYQALVARGISVFAPNVRGSSGFGKKFVNLDNGALRVDAVRDIKSCVDYLVAQKIADPKRIGIMGGSYGGFMTMAGLVEYPTMFAAGADLFGIVNFSTFFAHTEPWMASISKIEYGDPVTEADMLARLSPFGRIDRVVAPVIVLHGQNDTNVPVVEAEQVVANLKSRKVPVEYVLFPDEGHGWQKLENRVKSTTSIVAWFDRYLNN